MSVKGRPEILFPLFGEIQKLKEDWLQLMSDLKLAQHREV